MRKNKQKCYNVKKKKHFEINNAQNQTKMLQCEGKKHFEINNTQKQTKKLQCEVKEAVRKLIIEKRK
jgi:hypothetical protein